MDFTDIVPDHHFKELLSCFISANVDQSPAAYSAIETYLKQDDGSAITDNLRLAAYSVMAIEMLCDLLCTKLTSASSLDYKLILFTIHVPLDPESKGFNQLRDFFHKYYLDSEIQISLYIKLQTLMILLKNHDYDNAEAISRELDDTLPYANPSLINMYNLFHATILNHRHRYVEHIMLRLKIIGNCLQNESFDCAILSLCYWIKSLDWLRQPEVNKKLLLVLQSKYCNKADLISSTILYSLFSLDDRHLRPAEKMQYVSQLITTNIEFLTVQQQQSIYFFAGNYSSGMQSRVKESILYFQYSNYFIYKSWEYLRKVSAYLRTQLNADQYLHAMIFVETRLQEFSHLVSLQNNAYVETLQADYNKIEDLYKQVEELSVTDSLTGLHNRRFLENNIFQLITLSFRHKSRISFAMIDIDHFKKMNDTYGHLTGDYLLREVAQIIKRNFRKSDVVIRYGGEEFFLALFDMPRDHVCETLEILRMEIENTPFNYGDVCLQLTISIGITFRDYKSSEEIELTKIISEADSALYLAKNGGRNQTRIHE